RRGRRGERMRPGLLRNLEQIQETDTRSRGPRVGTLLLASLGAACVIFVIVSQSRHKAKAVGHAPDPLGDLVAQSKGAKLSDTADLGGKDVTFPSMLSDEARTTTALAAVRLAPAAASANAAGAPAPEAQPPPPPTDRLPVVPLPAKNIVASS